MIQRQKQDALFNELRKAEANKKSKKNNSAKKVTVAEVEKVVSRWSKVPVQELSKKETERLLNLEKNLHKRIIGQNESSDPNTASAKAFDNSVLPTPVGPRNTKLPIGFLGSDNPTLPRLIALLTASTASF